MVLGGGLKGNHAHDLVKSWQSCQVIILFLFSLLKKRDIIGMVILFSS